MAVSTSSYFSNSIVGVPQVAGELASDIYEKSSAPKFALGTKFERQDGAVFRYAHFTKATSAGMLVAAIASDIGTAMITSAAVTPSATYQMPNEQIGIYPGAAGSRYFVLCGSAAGVAVSLATANMYAGAYVTIASGTGAGHTYRVKGHTATGTPATGLTRFELYDPLIVAVGPATQLSIAGCKYNNLGVATKNIAPTVVGVVPIVQAPGYYGWVQTKGVAGVQADATATITSAGYICGLSTATAGTIGFHVYSTTTAVTNEAIQAPLIGTLVTLVSAAGVALVDLAIE